MMFKKNFSKGALKDAAFITIQESDKLLTHLRRWSPLRLIQHTDHLKHCLLLFATIAAFAINSSHYRLQQPADFDPWSAYGYTVTLLLYSLRCLILFSVPHTVLTFFGLVLYDAFPKSVVVCGSPVLAPFVCFRVVTRGDCPRLVRDNLTRNLNICYAADLKNFCIEVVTEKMIGLSESHRVREVVVPPEYRTKNGTLFKARNLQYCLEKDVNRLSDEDYIVHLDEDTVLTENSVRGILNFVLEGKHQFGQGVITYANEEIVNWITTLADSMKVGDILGKTRCQFLVFHKPLCGWMGSFMVAQVGAERDVSFDFGPDGSIAEDNFFAMKADQHGYTFDFIGGEMWDNSTLNLSDFIHQRKRWLQGLLLMSRNRDIPWRNKIWIVMMTCAFATLPLYTFGGLFTTLYPVPVSPSLDFLFAFLNAVNFYSCLFGVVTCFSLRRCGVLKYAAIMVGTICSGPAVIVLTNIAVIWALVGKKHKFHVVGKGVATITV